MIALIDYGAGNLRSISNACKSLNFKVEIVSEPENLQGAEKIILPGVGNFGSAMQSLEKFRTPLLEKIHEGTPFLGLCLGIQVILDSSEESPGVKGLGILKGECRKFQRVKVPHMGWNSVRIKNRTEILDGIKDGDYFYFVHSYYPVPADKGVVAATTDYGTEFPSVLAMDNIFAMQFHPEKSDKAGLKILQNFLRL